MLFVKLWVWVVGLADIGLMQMQSVSQPYKFLVRKSEDQYI